jgi:hypothetical protein
VPIDDYGERHSFVCDTGFKIENCHIQTNNQRKNMARVIIPKNKALAIKLAQAILVKHQADGAASPLAPLNIADMTGKTSTADTQNQLAAKLYRDAETATQNSDLALGSDYTTPGRVNYYLAAARDILLGIYKGNEQKLGDWGFEVDQSTSPQSAPVKAARAAAKAAKAKPAS